MTDKFTQKAQYALNSALEFARSLGHTYVGSEHILLGLVSERDSAAARITAARGVSGEKLRETVVLMAGSGNRSSAGADDMTPCVKKIIEESAAVSARFGQNYIGTEHLLFALLGERDSVGVRVLEGSGVQINDLKNDISAFLGGTAERTKPTAKKNEQKQSSVLSGFGRDLTAAARQGRLDPTVGRETETERVIQILSRRVKNNPCLIGEPGVGKTAVVEGLAQKIADGAVPETLRDRTVITLDLPSMIAGAKYRGEFEDRMKNVINEVTKRPEVILFIDELHTIVGAGAAEGAVDAANIIKPALARGEIRMIGATTIDEYRRHIEKDAALERRFQPVTVGEPSPEEAVKILRGLRDRYEAHHRLKISDEALRAAVTLSRRYIHDRFLPDKAIDLIDETAARLRVSSRTEPPELRSAEEKLNRLIHSKEEAIVSQNFERAAALRDEEAVLRGDYETAKSVWEHSRGDSDMTVTAADVAQTVSGWTGVPVGAADTEENERLINLEARLAEKVIGQEAAVSEVARAVRRGRAGLADPEKPIGSFIFLGPTGVGKTELSAALAEAVFGSRGALIRLDMSEYMERHSVSKLIGSPPGYVGYDEGGGLTELVRRRPYSLVLFDEIEKAHPDIFNLLLQILDEGRLTDSQGRTVDFRNTIVIMTSNLGSGKGGAAALGFSADRNGSDNERVMNALRETFRPEFINRIDNVVIFGSLSEESLEKISEIQLDKLSRRTESLGIKLTFDPSAVGLIAVSGQDKRYGARPIRRAVTKLVIDPFSAALINGSFAAGDTVRAYAEGDAVKFQKESAAD